MQILFIGGTQMTGPYVVRDLLAQRHDVWLLHRSHSESPLLKGATQIKGDKADLPNLRNSLAALRLDVIVHMVAFTEADALTFIQSMASVAARSIVISSIDVYRAYGRLHRTEPGTPDLVPLHEDAPLREKLSIHGTAYEKVAVERAAKSNPKFPCTILRYPAVYGPGDHQHRLREWTQRMDDRRPFILMGRSQSNWRFTHGYVENVAHALFLAITSPEAVGQTYNVGEADTPTWQRWAQRVGGAAKWNGSIRVIPDERLPSHLADDLDFRQDWTVDTSRIRRELGFHEIVPPADCLTRAIEWERANRLAGNAHAQKYTAEDAAASGGS
jgi:nucleoside-diphosphate-sugar epimerase